MRRTKLREKKLDDNHTRCCFEQSLEATTYKTAVVWSLTSHLTKMPRRARYMVTNYELISDAILWILAHGNTNIG